MPGGDQPRQTFVLDNLEVFRVGNFRWPAVLKWLAVLLVFGIVTSPGYGEQFKIGPITGQLGCQAGFEYKDNFNNSAVHKQSDFTPVFGPTINLSAGQQGGFGFATPSGDEFRLNVGLSYSIKPHLTTNLIETTFGAPVTVDLLIPIKLKYDDWKGSVGETFSYNDSSVENAVMAGQKSAPQYSNVVSANLDRNLGRADLAFNAQRSDKISPSASWQGETDYTTSVTPSFQLRENYRVFWSTVYGLTFPNDSTKQKSQSITSSIGLSGQITPAFSGSLQLGYGISHLSEKVLGPGGGIFGGVFSPVTLPASTVGGINASIAGSYTHPLRPNTTYGLSVYHSPGISALMSSASLSSVTGVSLSLAHQLSSKTVLMPLFQFTHMESAGITSSHDKQDLLSASMSLSRQLTEHLNWTAQYQYLYKISNLPNSTFDSTVITFMANYQF